MDAVEAGFLAADLAAQLSMAKSAVWMVGLTCWQVVATSIGTVLLIWTIKQGRTAQANAREALALSRESAQQQHSANRAQLRGYVGLEITNYRPVIGKPVAVDIRMTNHGTTPVTVSSVSGGMALIRNRTERPEFDGIYPGAEGALFHGAFHTLNVTADEYTPQLSVDLEKGLGAGGAALRIELVVQYRDIFGDEHQTSFALEITARGSMVSKGPTDARLNFFT